MKISKKAGIKSEHVPILWKRALEARKGVRKMTEKVEVHSMKEQKTQYVNQTEFNCIQTWIQKRSTQKGIRIGLALLAAVVLTGSVIRAETVTAQVHQAQRHMAQEVLRFHVLADSDKKEDQELKMKVKEAVLSYMEESLPKSDSLQETVQWAKSHTKQIEAIAVRVLREEGCMDMVRAEVGESYFPVKTYGDVTFPAGTYRALRIVIGSGEGQNWWCVLYPNLCFVDTVHAVVPKEGKEKLRSVLEEEEYEMVTAHSNFKIRWLFFNK